MKISENICKKYYKKLGVEQRKDRNQYIYDRIVMSYKPMFDTSIFNFIDIALFSYIFRTHDFIFK
jgi:hypothetical protein